MCGTTDIFLTFSHFSANIKVFYDLNFAAKFGADVKNVVRRVLAHTQHVLKWPSLTTKVILNPVYDVVPIPEYLNASSSV